MPKPAFELGTSAPPILQIDFFRHHFKDDDVVVVGLTAFPPKTFRRRLQIGGNALEISRQFLLDTIEIFPREGLAGVVGSGEKDLEKVHALNSQTAVNDCKAYRVPWLKALPLSRATEP
ncbi:hypothetical protein [Mesorhizobium sp. M7A.F.Ca.ET.027.03.2.1]|uniref:hypothetical protein n=1 Tax=Mesorhizobium sp. M7A.F.Ca.ET.027.03.2.1 TaxID=2496656 RepID=UPI0016788F03|nr:hypothetical protein [Mesorhizobium sp. M7A.F.Ca.ET.027.03.2.1]